MLVRSLEGYHATIRRVFRRHRIPLFLDRRESVAHHPLAELTRNALRTVAFGWQTEDWFGALKTGLCPVDPLLLAGFENEALAHGWDGRRWLAPLSIPNRPALGERLERLRQSLIPPFLALRDHLRGSAAGRPGQRTSHPPLGAQMPDAVPRLGGLPRPCSHARGPCNPRMQSGHLHHKVPGKPLPTRRSRRRVANSPPLCARSGTRSMSLGR
ncbi:MAG: hypothetical protein M5U12_04940 [Verrucomicrobia bacterium]|nr:hypothetical protein [Verrucomicrobiota bacterium]